MAAKATIAFDEKNQIIRMVLSGFFSESDLKEMTSEVTSIVDHRLKDRDNVKLLIDASKAGKADAQARRAVLADYSRDNVKKIAFFGITSPIVRTVARFMSIITSQQKFQFFESEAEAVQWLRKA